MKIHGQIKTAMEQRLQHLIRCLDECWDVRCSRRDPCVVMEHVPQNGEMRFYVAFMHLCNDLVDARIPDGPLYCDIGTSTAHEVGMVSS